MACTDIPIKFLGQRLTEPVSGNNNNTENESKFDPHGHCKRMLQTVNGSKSKKQFRNGWDKNLNIDILPNKNELRIFSPKQSSGSTDRIHKLSSIVGVEFIDNDFAITVKAGDGEHMCFAFGIKRKSDYFKLVANMLTTSSVLTPQLQPDPEPSTPIPSPQVNNTNTPESAKKVRVLQDKINTLESENASLKAGLDIETKKRLISERKMESSKRELAEVQAHMALLSAEMATDLAQIKSEELEDESAMVLAEVTDMKNALSMLGSKMDVLLNAHSNPTTTTAGADEQQRQLQHLLLLQQQSQSNLMVPEATSKLKARVSSRKSTNDRFINLMKRMSKRNLSTESADTGVFSDHDYDGNSSGLSSDSQDLQSFSPDISIIVPNHVYDHPNDTSVNNSSMLNNNNNNSHITEHFTEDQVETKVTIGSPLTEHPDSNPNNTCSITNGNNTNNRVGEVTTATTDKSDAASVVPPATDLDLSMSKICAQFRTLTGTDESSKPPGHDARADNDDQIELQQTDASSINLHQDGDAQTTAPDEPLPSYAPSPSTPSTHKNKHMPPLSAHSTPRSTPQQLNADDQSFQLHRHRCSSSAIDNMANTRDYSADWIRLTDKTEEVMETIVFGKGTDGVGFAIAGGLDEAVQDGDTAIYVSNIVVDGAAHIDDRLRRGDKILEANGVSLTDVTHDTAKQAILGQSSLTLTVSRLPIEDTFEVEYYSVEQTPIFELTPNANDCGILDVLPEALMWVGTHLRPRDAITSINGTVTKGKTATEWWQLLMPQLNTPTTIVITRIHEIYGHHSNNSTMSHTTIVEDHLEIAFKTSAAGLGFSIAGGCDHPVQPGDPSIYVTHIIDGCAAASDGRLCVGDRLMEVNGINTLSVQHADAVAALQLDPAGVHMHVSRLPVHEEELLDVEFDIGDGGLGFSIFGGYDQHGDEDPGILVLRITDGGSASRSGALQPGDKIIAVNGKELGPLMHDEAVTLLGAITGRIALRISRLTEIKKEREILVDVVLVEPEGSTSGLGFSVAGGTDHPIDDGDAAIYVTHITEGGIVHRDGQLRFGDKIVHVNGVDVTSVAHQEAIEALKTLDGRLELRVARYESPMDESEEVLRIEFPIADEQKLGLRIAGGVDMEAETSDSAVYVSEITDGAAALDGRLQQGDKILVCNGETFVHVTHAQALEALRSNPNEIKLTISRLTEHSTA